METYGNMETWKHIEMTMCKNDNDNSLDGNMLLGEEVITGSEGGGGDYW